MSRNLRLSVIYALCTAFFAFSMFFGYGQFFNTVTALATVGNAGMSAYSYIEYTRERDV